MISAALNRRQFLRLGAGGLVLGMSACGAGAPAVSSPAASVAPSAPSSAAAKPASASAAASGSASAAAASGSAAAVASKPAASPAVSAAPGTQLVRIATVGSISDAGFYLADDRGYMKEVGLTPDFQVLRTGPQMVPLLATGQLDVAGGSVSGALFSAIQRGIPLRIVADKGSNRPNFTFAYILARKDLAGQLKGFADLKGRKVAISAPDNSGQYLLYKALKSVGLTLKDVETTNLGYPDQGPGFANKAIDAGQNIEPFATNWVSKDFAVIMPNQNNVYDGFQAAVLMYGPKFVEEKPDVGKKLMVAYLKGVRDYNLAFTKGKDKDAVIGSLLKHTTVKDRALYDKMGLPGLNPDGAPIEEEIMSQQEFFLANGYQKEKLDLKPVLDHQFVDYALNQLGKFSG